jgi:hypothetical protein
MGKAFDALHGTERRNTHLDCIARTQKGQLFEKVANHGGFL